MDYNDDTLYQFLQDSGLEKYRTQDADMFWKLVDHISARYRDIRKLKIQVKEYEAERYEQQ